MPCYTDLDNLIDVVEGTTWYHINKNGELVMGANSKDDVPLYKHEDIARVLSEAPEADVVPKSEVERLKADNKRLTHILNCYALQYGTVKDQQAVIDKAKAEVAREIFAEIEDEITEAIKSNYKRRTEYYTKERYKKEDEEFITTVNGKIDALRGIDGFVEELKKKYTQDCRTCKHMLSCEPNVFGICDEYDAEEV